MPPTELPPSRAGAGAVPPGPQGGQDGENVLTRHLGPLPVWAWAVVVAGAVLVARALGGKPATGGESMPAIGAPPDVTGGDLGGGTGGDGAPGPAGPPGPTGTALPSPGYTGIVNQIADWFQQLSRTTQLINVLKDRIARTSDPAQKRALTATLNIATGKTVKAGGKFSTGGTTYYQLTFITKAINDLQTSLKGLTA